MAAPTLEVPAPALFGDTNPSNWEFSLEGDVLTATNNASKESYTGTFEEFNVIMKG